MKPLLWPIALCFMACGSSEVPVDAPRPRGIVATQDRTPQAPKPTAAATAAPAPTAEALPSAEPTPAAAVEKKQEAPTRDYGAELLAALGAPVDCLHQRSGADAPSELHVDVQVYLLETGFVSRAYARSSALDPQEVQCLTKRAGALRLQGPIEAAPRAVSATLTLTLQRVEKPAAEKPQQATPQTNENP